MGVGQGPGSDHLIPLSAKAAFTGYEAVRHRLPEAGGPARAPRQYDTLEDIADDFDVFLLDAFGVLNIGETAIPDAPERVKRLQAAGKRVLVVSNAASLPHSSLVEKYQRLGYAFTPDDIVTSRATLLAAMTDLRGLQWGLMASRGAGTHDLGDLAVSYLEDDPATYDAVDGFLMIGSAGWTEHRQALLEAALERPRPVLVGNPDIVAPRETGFSAEPGYFAHRLADRTGVEVKFFGKPFANIFELAFSRLGGIDRSRVVMVGDSLHTDILGAHAAGIASALITGYGFFAGQDAARAVEATGIVPDYLVRRP